MQTPKIYIALPVLNEFENLPTLIKCLKEQSVQGFEIIACVNQYESWWGVDDKKSQYHDNQSSIQYLNDQNDLTITVIDKSSKGKGWPDKRGGVGWARKVAMDYINHIASANDLIICIDADTYYPPNYLESSEGRFIDHPEIAGLCVPYYHQLDGSKTDTLILRYEIYMRNYMLNMLRIHNPYAFTALGSAMIAPVWAYRKIGGITPVKSGEDFYFLQKLAKNGKLSIWTDTIAYPSSRFSDRVLFGTGPALIKGNSGNWDSYPVYDAKMFDLVKETFEKFPDLFKKDVPTPMDEFLQNQFKSDDLWTPLRDNYKDQNNFTKACIRKVDGLRILQFLKQLNLHAQISSTHSSYQSSDALGSKLEGKRSNLDDKELNITELARIREDMFQKESELRRMYQYVGL